LSPVPWLTHRTRDIDFEDRIAEPQGHHVARQADITLQTTDDLHFDLDDPGYGFDLGPSDGIGSQDFGELDLGLDFGDGPVSVVDGSVEVGRDAPTPRSPRESLDSRMFGKGGEGDDFFSHISREPSEHPFGADMDVDMGFGLDTGGMDIDLGIDFGDGVLSEREKTPEQTRSPSRMCKLCFILYPLRCLSDVREIASPLTEPPQTPPPDLHLTPKAVAQELGDDEATAKTKRKPKEKKQIIDDITELTDGPGARAGRGLGAPVVKDVSDILADQQSLPRSAVVMRLMEIREDPLAYFLPTKVTPEGTFFFAGPPGLAPELSDLFMRPLQNSLPTKKRGASPDKGGRKKPRVEESVHEDEHVEQARRDASVAPSIALASEALGGRASMAPDGGFDFGDMTGGLDEFQMDVGGEFPLAHDTLGPEGSKGPATDRSRLSTPTVEGEEGEETYADMTCPIVSFEGSSQTQETSSDGEGTGYSKNTVKALGIIRNELRPEGREDEGEHVMSFRKMSEKASRRAASAFFFELLVLGTRDCVKLSQSAPFENIEIRAKDKLWERQRHGSIAPSIVSARG